MFPISTSDHNGLELHLNVGNQLLLRTPPKERMLWQYQHADFNKAMNLIEQTPWHIYLINKDINELIGIFQRFFSQHHGTVYTTRKVSHIEGSSLAF